MTKNKKAQLVYLSEELANMFFHQRVQYLKDRYENIYNRNNMLDNKEIDESLQAFKEALKKNPDPEPTGPDYDLKVLPDGQFIAFEKVTIASTMVNGAQSIDKLTAKYLSILPEGTRLLAVEKRPIYSICIPYVILFSNPLLKKVKRVELQYIRDVELVDNEYKNFNVITGMSYFDVNDKELYKNF